MKSKLWKIKFEWRILGILKIVFFLRSKELVLCLFMLRMNENASKVSNTMISFQNVLSSSLIYVFVVTSNYLPTYFADVWFLNSTWFLPTHEHNFFNDDGWPLLVMGWVPHWLIVYFLNFGHVFSLPFFIRKLYKVYKLGKNYIHKIQKVNNQLMWYLTHH